MRNIVLATEEEKAEILALYKAQLGKEFCPWDEHYPEMEQIEFDLSRASLFVMKEEGRIISAISIDQDEVVEGLSCWSEELSPGGELSRLAVLEQYQNQGIAREMILFAMEELRRRGYKSVHFLVNKHNVKALSSYKHLQFSIVGDCTLYEQPFACYEKAL